MAVFVPVIIVVVLLGSFIHDVFFVHDWEISNIMVDPGVSDIPIPKPPQPSPGAPPPKSPPLLQEIDVSLVAKDSRWLWKFGNIQPSAYFIFINEDPNPQPINKCYPASTKSCPGRTNGINHAGTYTEHFSIQWDTVGWHTINMDVRVDGVMLGQLTAGVNIHH